MHIYSKSVHTNACNKQSDVCYLSYFHVHTAINILRCFGYPREHNFGLVLILSPTGCTEGCVYFPQSWKEYTPPPFSRLSTQYHIDPLLILVCFLSILHERVCDYSRVQSSVTGILRMGDMNIHITWLTHVRTGPPQKNRHPHARFHSKCGHPAVIIGIPWNLPSALCSSECRSPISLLYLFGYICSLLPEFTTLYLHLTCFDNWSYRQCCTHLQ